MVVSPLISLSNQALGIHQKPQSSICRSSYIALGVFRFSAPFQRIPSALLLLEGTPMSKTGDFLVVSMGIATLEVPFKAENGSRARLATWLVGHEAEPGWQTCPGPKALWASEFWLRLSPLTSWEMCISLPNPQPVKRFCAATKLFARWQSIPLLGL